MKSVAGRFDSTIWPVDRFGEEWLSFADIGIFPFVEIKVDRKFVAGCAENALKQIGMPADLDLADIVGARTLAEGVETGRLRVCARMGFEWSRARWFANRCRAQIRPRRAERPLAMPH